jgi:hypothetical protein
MNYGRFAYSLIIITSVEAELECNDKSLGKFTGLTWFGDRNMDTPIEAILEFSFFLRIVDVNEPKGNHSRDGFGVTEATHRNRQTTNSNSLPKVGILVVLVCLLAE